MPSYSGDIFLPISTIEPPAIFPRITHPLAIPAGVVNLGGSSSSKIPTNNFYTNLLLDTQTLASFVLPYSVWWAKSDPAYVGLAVSHTRASQRVFGPEPSSSSAFSPSNPAKYFLNPIGIMSVVLGANEFHNQTMTMGLEDPDAFSVGVKMRDQGNATMWAPLAQGMGFVTAVYENATPIISSMVGFKSIQFCNDNSGASSSPRLGVQKWRLSLFDNTTWLMYTTSGGDGPAGVSFNLRDQNHLVANTTVSNLVVQIAYSPDPALEYVFDDTVGIYPIGVSLAGTTLDGKSATYSLDYQIRGSSNSGSGLIYALPHHVESFDVATMASRVTSLHVDSLTKGVMTGVVTNSLIMTEPDLPIDIGFLPWSALGTSGGRYTMAQLQFIETVARQELTQDINAQTNLDSMYFSGKALDKFAFILLTLHSILQNRELALMLLDRLKVAFSVFAQNRQIHPLAYDTTWGGIVSMAGLGPGNSGQDFGNSYYNDHHFHYGYFVHCAAVIAHVDGHIGDGTWLAANQDWISALLRDVANPNPSPASLSSDQYFPTSRSFNWYHGHSWAKGLFLSGDGKDQESSSEDYHFAYAMKLWGSVTADGAMVARSNLMLAIMKRSFNKYVLYYDDNTTEPQEFIGNRVNGITFENKFDYSTYFGANIEYIHGIHMIPISPVSSFIRRPRFVQREWDTKLASVVNGLDSGWRGILKLNQALYDPNQASDFFASPDFQDKWLDGGMSRTWALAYCYGVGS